MKQEYINPLINIAIMAPSIYLIYHIFPFVFGTLNLYIFGFIVALPLIKFIVPKKYDYIIYPTATIVFLVLLLITMLQDAGLVTIPRYLAFLEISYDVHTFASVIIGANIILIYEGIVANRIYKTVGYLLLSVGTLLDQLAIVTFMSLQGQGYLYSYEYINAEELFSLYTLFLQGFQKVLPLATMNIPVNTQILATFIISTIGVIAHFYFSDRERNSEITNRLAYPVFSGAILGMAAFSILRLSTPYGYQLFSISLSMLAMVIALVYSSRRSKKS